MLRLLGSGSLTRFRQRYPVVLRGKRWRVRSHSRQIKHEAGNGGYPANTTHPPAHWPLSQASERDRMDSTCGQNSAPAGKVGVHMVLPSLWCLEKPDHVRESFAD